MRGLAEWWCAASGASRTTAVLLFLFAAAGPAAAQSDPRLIAAVRNAQEGQGDSARTVVNQLLSRTRTSDTLYPQILYTSAMIANDAAEMRRQLQRVAVEFPTSSWADDALLRLVQLDYATRNLQGAGRNLERIRVDFPGSPLVPQAAYWAGRTYFDLKQDAQACRWLADGMARAREDVETQIQLGYLYQRCDLTAKSDTGAGRQGVSSTSRGTDSAARQPAGQRGTSAAAPGSNLQTGDTGSLKSSGKPPVTRSIDSTPAPTAGTHAGQPAAQRTSPAARPGPRFRIQLAAVANAGAAEAVARKAQAAGFTTVTVQEQGLYKVRAGEFPTRAEAQAAATQLKAKLGGSPFIVAEK